MLKIVNLSKRFDKVEAIKNMSFHIPKGEVVGLVGPNGAGKTTLIKCICTILDADEGQILIDGIDMYEHPVDAKKKIAYIAEVPEPYWNLSVWNHIGLMANAYYKTDWEKDAERYLEIFNLTEKRNESVNKLSKGQKQKLMIICAFIHNPELILMDEPLVGIDPEGAYELKELIREFQAKGATILISCHTLSLIEEVCETIIIMHEANMIYHGKIKDLLDMETKDGKLENAFIQITKQYKSKVEEKFEEVEPVRRRGLFGWR